MKKIILLILLSFYSCKHNDETNINISVDTTSVNSNQYVNDNTISLANDSIELPVKEFTFEDAVSTTSANELRDFISKNLNHKEIDLLNKRLIDLEVNEIFDDQNTGKMPVSEKTGSNSSSTSIVSISNDTSCELIVRYSGKDSKMISIPASKTMKVSIKSGGYRITASACGHNYAGSEELNGDYDSRYYIETSYR